MLGSQGDAGQFRTPRHIIDFMVEIVDPKKNETVLDPACGTAGFLISSYKHILKANTDAKGNSTLTPDEKGRLAQNFKGYDISPDMVRLSLVNLYLHGFTDPHIYEYDTLTSQDRWNEYADVILANPPFMSPKGGIKPHNRFSVQSKRSEVLFVDYMAEHLTPSGRAGIIVPEGIIFQSQTAYKQLRKMLVEEYLVAVVSLPAGVFNPYSGVKTSILILDKSLARKTDTIAFFKVENDGFGLGAQRRAIRQERPAAGPSRDRRIPAPPCAAGNPPPTSSPTLRPDRAERRRSPRMATTTSAGSGIGRTRGIEVVPLLRIGKRFAISRLLHHADRSSSRAISEFIFVGSCANRLRHSLSDCLTRRRRERCVSINIPKGFPKSIQIPLPPLEVQKEIVAEIEGYQKVIDGARAVLDNYRPHIPIHPDWPMVESTDVRDGTHDSPKYVLDGYPLITSKNLKDGFLMPRVQYGLSSP